MNQPPAIDPDLVRHLCHSVGLTPERAAHLIRETLAFYSEPLEGFVARRHRELQQDVGLRNEAIFRRIAAELAERRFPAPALSLRQIRRIIYG